MAEPNLNPRKARFAPPPGACDAHCHVYGEGTRYPALDAAQLFAHHRHFGFSHAVIVQAVPEARAVTLAALAAAEGRYRGVALVDGATDDAELRALHQAGVRGVRFTFVPHLGGAPDLAMVRRVLKRIADLGWHVTFLMDPADIVANRALFDEIAIPFVIDHMGRMHAAEGVEQPGFRALLELMRRENAWVKLSGPDRITAAGPPFADALPYAQALLAAAPDRCLWGSDWPHPNNPWRPDDADLIELLPQIAPDARLRQTLLVENPARLYGF
jgi:predicted TIM-barrel fold metal-dependent hydrolase